MRTTKAQVFMNIAKELSSLATCSRRSVGCIAIDVYDHIIATGYNGVPQGSIHCTRHPCKGASHESGDKLHECLAIHAEQNMLLQCSDVTRISAIFTTTFPCDHCLKMLLNTGCKRIYYSEDYSLSTITWPYYKEKI